MSASIKHMQNKEQIKKFITNVCDSQSRDTPFKILTRYIIDRNFTKVEIIDHC